MKKDLWLLLAVLVLALANVFIGSADINFRDVLAVLTGDETDAAIRFIILDGRIPQTVTALLTGAALAVAGLLLQTAFHNPLAGPSVLGISGGAALGVAIVALCGGAGIFSVMGAAFTGAAAVTLLLLFLSTLLRSNLVLLITGLLLGYLISAIITILGVCATSEGLRGYVLWGMGDFSSVGTERLPAYALALLALMLLSVLMIKPMNALQLGDGYAANLGVSVRVLRGVLLLLVGGVTAITTAMCGPVAFIGLAVPHIARLWCRSDDFRRLVPLTLLAGALVALFCNLLCVLPRHVLPLNAVTPLVGVPVIVYVLVSRRF